MMRLGAVALALLGASCAGRQAPATGTTTLQASQATAPVRSCPQHPALVVESHERSSRGSAVHQVSWQRVKHGDPALQAKLDALLEPLLATRLAAASEPPVFDDRGGDDSMTCEAFATTDVVSVYCMGMDGTFSKVDAAQGIGGAPGGFSRAAAVRRIHDGQLQPVSLRDLVEVTPASLAALVERCHGSFASPDECDRPDAFADFALTESEVLFFVGPYGGGGDWHVEYADLDAWLAPGGLANLVDTAGTRAAPAGCVPSP